MTPQDREREAALSNLAILDTMPEKEFDIVARLAQKALNCPIALISLIDRERQWNKAKIGLDAEEAATENSFCAHAVRNDELLVVPDATRDPRFAANPMVLGEPHVRFYAGAPIRATIPGSIKTVAVGTLCVVDDKARALSDIDLDTLIELAHLVEALMRARVATAREAALAEEQRVAYERLHRKQRQFRQAERMANFGSWRLCLTDNSTQWSEQTFAIHGLDADRQPDLEAALAFYPPHARDAVSAAVLRTVQTGRPFDLEADFTAADGVAKKIRCMGEIELSNGVPVAVIGVMQDITERHRMEQELRRKAVVDELTQLGNRAGCNRALSERIAAARAQRTPLALMLIDLDGFKQVNDRCGHLVGDDLLRLIGLRLKAPYLARCYVGRMGGDEFVVLADSEQDCAHLDSLLRRLLHDLRHTVSHQGETVKVSGTIGVAWLDGAVSGPSDLLHRADLLLYEAKREAPGTARLARGAARTTIEAPSSDGLSAVA